MELFIRENIRWINGSPLGSERGSPPSPASPGAMGAMVRGVPYAYPAGF